MTASSLLESLCAKGVTLAVEPTGLRYRALPGTVTPQLLDELRTHKEELVMLLARRCPFCAEQRRITSSVIKEDLLYVDTHCMSCRELIECYVPANQA